LHEQLQQTLARDPDRNPVYRAQAIHDERLGLLAAPGSAFYGGSIVMPYSHNLDAAAATRTQVSVWQAESTYKLLGRNETTRRHV